MNEECIIVYIGYVVLFILTIIMTKLYNTETNKCIDLEYKNMDLLISLEILEPMKQLKEREDDKQNNKA